MSPRKARRRPDGVAPPPLRFGPERTESWPDGDWVVRAVPGAAAAKPYRCPGCDQEIRSGTAHIVAWPAWQAGAAGAAGRRHWHRACWQRRLQRHPPGRRG